MKTIYFFLSGILLSMMLFSGCSETPGEKELAEQKALMAECQAAGSVAQEYYKTSTDKGGGDKSFIGYEIPQIIQSESSGPFAVKQSSGIIRIIEQEKDLLLIEGRPLDSKKYNWKIISTITPYSVLTEVVSN